MGKQKRTKMLWIKDNCYIAWLVSNSKSRNQLFPLEQGLKIRSHLQLEPTIERFVSFSYSSYTCIVVLSEANPNLVVSPWSLDFGHVLPFPFLHSFTPSSSVCTLLIHCCVSGLLFLSPPSYLVPHLTLVPFFPQVCFLVVLLPVCPIYSSHILLV